MYFVAGSLVELVPMLWLLSLIVSIRNDSRICRCVPA